MNKIVERIAKEGLVESIIRNITKNSKDEDLRDLANDIYLELLEKSEDCLMGIYERGQINYFLTRIVLNNINSKTSRFYYIYKKNKKRLTQMEDATEKGEEPDYN